MSTDQRNDTRLRLRFTFFHWEKERVRWSDTDMVGHLNNLAFAAYCETGRTHFLHEIIAANVDQGTLLVLAQIMVNFLGEVHWPATIDIGTGVLSIGRSSLRMGHGLFDGDRCVATAESVIVSIDQATRKPCPLPDAARDYLIRYQIAA